MENDTKQIAVGVGVFILILWLLRRKKVNPETGAGGGGTGGMPYRGTGTMVVPTHIQPPPPNGGVPVVCPQGKVACPNGRCYDANRTTERIYIGTINGVYGEHLIDPCSDWCMQNSSLEPCF